MVNGWDLRYRLFMHHIRVIHFILMITLSQTLSWPKLLGRLLVVLFLGDHWVRWLHFWVFLGLKSLNCWVLFFVIISWLSLRLIAFQFSIAKRFVNVQIERPMSIVMRILMRLRNFSFELIVFVARFWVVAGKGHKIIGVVLIVNFGLFRVLSLWLVGRVLKCNELVHWSWRIGVNLIEKVIFIQPLIN